MSAMIRVIPSVARDLGGWLARGFAANRCEPPARPAPSLTLGMTAVSLLFVALPLFGEQKTPPPPAPPHPMHWPVLDERHLANGMTLVLVPLPNVPKITLDLGFHAGPAMNPGLAQLASRMLTEGTPSRSSKQI